MRSKSRWVAIMMTNTAASVSGTAAATTMPTRQPRLARLTIITTARATKNFSMNSSIDFADVDGLIGNLRKGEAYGKVGGNLLLLVVERLPELKAVPTVLHDDAKHHRRLAIMTDQKCGRVLVATGDLGDVGQLQNAAIGHDGACS